MEASSPISSQLHAAKAKHCLWLGMPDGARAHGVSLKAPAHMAFLPKFVPTLSRMHIAPISPKP